MIHNDCGVQRVTLRFCVIKRRLNQYGTISASVAAAECVHLESCYYHIHQLRCIHAYLHSTTTCTIDIAIVYSKLNYCKSLSIT